MERGENIATQVAVGHRQRPLVNLRRVRESRSQPVSKLVQPISNPYLKSRNQP